MVRVYGASLTKHAQMWIDWAEKHSEVVTLQSRWQAKFVAGATETPQDAREFWKEDEHDVEASDILIVYAADGDILRGALVEAGMAIALGTSVYIIGKSESYGTWQYHPSVTRIGSLTEFAKAL